MLPFRPPRANAKIDSATRDVVDRDRLLEQEGRIAVGVAADHDPETH
jgi:hypothetical protein